MVPSQSRREEASPCVVEPNLSDSVLGLERLVHITFDNFYQALLDHAQLFSTRALVYATGRLEHAALYYIVFERGRCTPLSTLFARISFITVELTCARLFPKSHTPGRLL